VSADVTVDMCTTACVTDILYFPVDRWHCSIDLSSADDLPLTAHVNSPNHARHLAR